MTRRDQSGDVDVAEGEIYRAGARLVRVQAVDSSSGVPRVVVVEVFPPCPGATIHDMLGGSCCRRSKAERAPFEVQASFSGGAWRMPARYLREG